MTSKEVHVETALHPEFDSIRGPGRCGYRSPLERTLLVLLLSMSALCAVLIILLARKPPDPATSAASIRTEPGTTLGRASGLESCEEGYSCGPPICITQDCVKAAASLLRNMDTGVDPCEDFYQFSCGRWPQHHTLPPDRAHYDTFSQMKDELKAAIREVLEKPADASDSNSTINAKNLYASCMNESLIESRQEAPLQDLLSNLGGWPVAVGNWTSEDFDWVRLVALLRQLNNDILFGQWVGPDSKNSSIHVIQLDQADLGLPSRDYYGSQGTEQLNAYRRFMVDVAELMGASTRDFAVAEMEQVLRFETKLSNLTIPSEERRNFTAIYRKVTLGELQNLVPQVNWTLYFKLVIPVGINESEEIVVYALEYIKGMIELVENTPQRVVANYILWRFIYNRASNLDSRFLEKQQAYFKALYGTQTTPPRWKTCTVYVNKNMGMAVGALFVKERFNHKSKEKAIEMIADIKEAFFQILEEVHWMDNQTLQIAKRKAEMMTQKIGYPEYIKNPIQLDKDYSGVAFKTDTYFENVINSLRHYTFKEQIKLRTVVDKSQWVTSPAVVNAFYTRSKNFISFPAGILQPPLYHQNYPRSLNYGGIGVVIGHEITHGFDDKGRQFDQFGNLKQWWHSQALSKFQQQAECMIDQYSKYVLNDINMRVNGINTQGENIADNGGVKQAFRAYKNWEARNGAEAILPGLNLTHYQLFFLNYAQIWCGTMRPEAAINTIRTGAHSPGNFRVIGALSNSKEFAEVYNCPLNSPMNPVNKCKVW